MPPTIMTARDEKNNDIVGWVADPNGRGTSGLVISCLLTLGLCVWSAMHLNIPVKHEGQREFWLRRVKWSTCGVPIPELVVLLAWRQWTSAGRLTKEVNKIFNNGKSTLPLSNSNPRSLPSTADISCNDFANITRRKHMWTNIHSFYAGSGGFVFELDESKNGCGLEPFVSGPQRLTLTAHGVLLLARSGLVPDVDKREILDKSKTDALAKSLVLLQAGWMLLQTVGRIATRIPISLLEVNTIGHIMCAFVVYLLWWNKPREIHEPTVLRGDWVDSMCAYMYMSSRISGPNTKGILKPRSWVTPELRRCLYLESDNGSNPPVSSPHSDVIEAFSDPSNSDSPMDINQEDDLASTRTVQSRGMLQMQPSRYPDSQKTISRKLMMGWISQPISDTFILREARHKLVVEAIQKFPAVKNRFKNLPSDTEDVHRNITATYEPFIEQLVVRRARNWPSDFLLPGLKGETMGMTLWLATMIYGGVHIAAWNEYFPTETERLLWHLSSVYITRSGLLWLLMNVMGAVSPWAKSYWHRFIALQAFWIEYVFYGVIATACGVLYILARAFLVVDAVVTLRQIPAQTYATPEWSEIIPHL
ncbi:hypothetical protein ONS95_004414 [Cadophora gregata]|uniref:uncharacterized protein n=1 Tax=Cadophora gregata TaxID=51156 RepID=UPI0026DBBBD6|nr:uncharacterized protein ONS95_004414 [Cadophora gregata]KAK0105190.1 hypothetical protein ONS96_004591 [Cadophora gregata f. sp. sojae]KAK0105901.1 hypothetical protein ONS95_004414 [Cadophora gregata]